jgi:hypothetical protein
MLRTPILCRTSSIFGLEQAAAPRPQRIAPVSLPQQHLQQVQSYCACCLHIEVEDNTKFQMKSRKLTEYLDDGSIGGNNPLWCLFPGSLA